MGMGRRLLIAAVLACALAPASASAAAPTVVSIEFDDGIASQWTGHQILAAHGMPATYFVNSARIGAGGRLTASQLGQLDAGGDEIGGHTLHHLNLTTVDDATARHEVCDD